MGLIMDMYSVEEETNVENDEFPFHSDEFEGDSSIIAQKPPVDSWIDQLIFFVCLTFVHSIFVSFYSACTSVEVALPL